VDHVFPGEGQRTLMLDAVLFGVRFWPGGGGGHFFFPGKGRARGFLGVGTFFFSRTSRRRTGGSVADDLGAIGERKAGAGGGARISRRGFNASGLTGQFLLASNSMKITGQTSSIAFFEFDQSIAVTFDA